MFFFSILYGSVCLWTSLVLLGLHLVANFWITVMSLNISIISWNVRGLNSKFKRALVLKFLQAQHPHIMFLQETHLLGNKILAMKRPWIHKAIHATYSSYARGVSILLHKSLPCSIETVITDPGGRYLVVIIEVYSRRLALVNVYISPPFTGNILYEVLEKLAPHAPFQLLVAGDFNNIINYTLDTSNPHSAPNHVLQRSGGGSIPRTDAILICPWNMLRPPE